MPSPTRSNHRRIVGLVLSGLMGALLVVSKQAMSGLPNIEPVTLLIILFALELPRETPAAITVFILLQGVLYGFGLWWAMYLYIWYLLALLAWLFRRMDHALFWAVFSGLYGLCFGGLCAAVYLFAKSLCVELVAERLELRRPARRRQLCHYAGAVQAAAQGAKGGKTADWDWVLIYHSLPPRGKVAPQGRMRDRFAIADP